MAIMKLNKFLLILLFLSQFSSCIEEYSPQIKSENFFYVIEGRITNTPGMHYVFISKSSSINDLINYETSNCDVKIYDGENNIFQAYDLGNGTYVVNIPEEYLHEGSVFKLSVVTPDDQLIVSDFDTLRICPEIEDLYYEVESIYDEESERTKQFLQFYIDYNGINTNTRYIKYEVEETWHYKATYPIKYYLAGTSLIYTFPPDYSKRNCWIIENIPEFFVLSTKNLTENIYNKYPFHTISNKSIKIMNGYSLLIKQYSISREAYFYYKKLEKNKNTSGGLYNTQPQLIEGNLYNTTVPDQPVLGYFSVSGFSSKRFSYRTFNDFSYFPELLCKRQEIELQDLRAHHTGITYLQNNDGKWYRLSDECVDCTTVGGDTIKPDYWPY